MRVTKFFSNLMDHGIVLCNLFVYSNFLVLFFFFWNIVHQESVCLIFHILDNDISVSGATWYRHGKTVFTVMCVALLQLWTACHRESSFYIFLSSIKHMLFCLFTKLSSSWFQWIVLSLREFNNVSLRDSSSLSFTMSCNENVLWKQKFNLHLNEYRQGSNV